MLQVKNISKKYKKADFYSVNDVSFALNHGEIVGLVGRNGAGKTSLMKMLIKTSIPTTGTIQLDGRNIFEADYQLNDIGILIEPVFYDHLTAYENIVFYLAVNNQKKYISNIQPLLELVDLWKVKDKKPGGFSFGMKQRLGLALCLVTEPKLAILDEPFVGLDPIGVRDLIGTLKSWAKDRQMTVLISSHQLAELESLCDRYLFIEQGSLVKEMDGQSIGEVMTIIHLKEPEDFSYFDGVTMIDEKTLQVSQTGEQFGDLISEISKSNTILNIETIHHSELSKFFEEEK